MRYWMLTVLTFTLAVEVVVIKVGIGLRTRLYYETLIIEVAMTMPLAGACK